MPRAKRYILDVRNEAPAPYNRWRPVLTFEVDGKIIGTEALPTYATEAQATNVGLGYLTQEVNHG